MANCIVCGYMWIWQLSPRSPKAAAPMHPPPWAPEIGTAASSSFWLPSPRNSGATMGWGLSGEHRQQPPGGGGQLHPHPPRPHCPTQRTSIAAFTSAAIFLEPSACAQEKRKLSEGETDSLDHPSDPCSGSSRLQPRRSWKVARQFSTDHLPVCRRMAPAHLKSSSAPLLLTATISVKTCSGAYTNLASFENRLH